MDNTIWMQRYSRSWIRCPSPSKYYGLELISLAGGLPLRSGVRVRGGLMLRKQTAKRVQGAEKKKGFKKGPLSCRRARRLTVDLAALESEDRQGVSATPIQATARSAPPCMSHNWGQGGAAAPQRGGWRCCREG